MVGVTFEGEQTELDLGEFQRHGTTHGHEKMFLLPPLSILKATQTRHNRKDVGQKQVAGRAAPLIVIGPLHEGLQETANCKTPAKGLKQTQTAKAGETAFFEDEIESSGSFGHIAQCYLKGRFVQRPDHKVATCYSCG
jgi:hypothetical protein